MCAYKYNSYFLYTLLYKVNKEQQSLIIMGRTHTDPLFYSFKNSKLYLIKSNVIMFFLDIKYSKIKFTNISAIDFHLSYILYNTRFNNQFIIPQINRTRFGTYSIKYHCINA